MGRQKNLCFLVKFEGFYCRFGSSFGGIFSSYGRFGRVIGQIRILLSDPTIGEVANTVGEYYLVDV